MTTYRLTYSIVIDGPAWLAEGEQVPKRLADWPDDLYAGIADVGADYLRSVKWPEPTDIEVLL
jgi:hypothetical protein